MFIALGLTKELFCRESKNKNNFEILHIKILRGGIVCDHTATLNLQELYRTSFAFVCFNNESSFVPVFVEAMKEN